MTPPMLLPSMALLLPPSMFLPSMTLLLPPSMLFLPWGRSKSGIFWEPN
jgi:hypothetical protein